MMRPVQTDHRPGCTVVILTRNRPHYLMRALQSVGEQTCRANLQVLLVNDGGPVEPHLLQDALGKIPLSFVALKPDAPEGVSTVARVARLRNLAVSMIETGLAAFLDDDNVWTSDHLASLFECMHTSRAPAAHSWRLTQNSRGSLLPLYDFPWARSAEQRRQKFARAVSAGIMEAGSPLIRDAASAIVQGQDVGMVDMGAWLFTTSLLRAFPLSTEFSEAQLRECIGEDDRLLWSLRDKGVPIACSRSATLRYTLGGFSNGGPGDGFN